MALLALVPGLPLISGLPVAHAAPDIDRMQSHTVRILCRKGSSVGTGSGFVVGDGRHVLTNWHVAGEGTCGVLVAPREIIPVKVIGGSDKVDLAVLELARDSGRPPVPGFAVRETVQKGSDVFVIGFPGAADAVAERATGVIDASVTKGVISRLIRDAETGTQQYQTDAAINPGNSGGPVFNECGQVVGISVAKIVRRGVEGIGLTIQAEEVFPELDRLRIRYTRITAVCRAGGRATAWQLVLASGVAVLVVGTAAVALGATRRGRAAVRELVRTRVVRRAAPTPDPAPIAAPPFQPVLVGLAGEFAGVELPLVEEYLVIGRDPAQAQLVFRQGEGVSKQHCAVRADRTTRAVYLEDCGSTNGTFRESGERLAPRTPTRLQAGDRFYLGDPSKRFQVRF